MKISKSDKVDYLGLDCEGYNTDSGCTILIGVEGKDRLHLSISHPKRYPMWDEIKEVRIKLLPDNKDFAMIFPKSNDYVNAHPNCFHLWEIKNGEMEDAIDRF